MYILYLIFFSRLMRLFPQQRICVWWFLPKSILSNITLCVFNGLSWVSIIVTCHTHWCCNILMEGKENKKMGWKGMSSIDCFIYFACNVKQLPYLYLWKKVLCFSPNHSVCLSVCVSVCLSVCVFVCHHVCGDMAGLSNMVSSEVNTIYKNLKMQHYSRWSVSISVSYGPSGQNHILACNFKTYGRIHTKFYLYVG